MEGLYLSHLKRYVSTHILTWKSYIPHAVLCLFDDTNHISVALSIHIILSHHAMCQPVLVETWNPWARWHLKSRRLDYLLNRLFRRRSKKTSKLRVTGLCEGKSPVTGEFPVQRGSNAENVSIWWRHACVYFYVGMSNMARSNSIWIHVPYLIDIRVTDFLFCVLFRSRKQCLMVYT